MSRHMVYDGNPLVSRDAGHRSLSLATNYGRQPGYGRIPYVHSTSEYPFRPVMGEARYPGIGDPGKLEHPKGAL